MKTKKINYRNYAPNAHETEVQQGYWEGKPNLHSLISKINCEVAGFEESYREKNNSNLEGYNLRTSLLNSGAKNAVIRDHAYKTFLNGTRGDKLAGVAIDLMSFAEGVGVTLQREHFKNNDQILNIALESCNMYIMINRLFALVSDLGIPIVLGNDYYGHFHHDTISNCLHAVEFICKYLDIDLELHIQLKMENALDLSKNYQYEQEPAQGDITNG